MGTIATGTDWGGLARRPSVLFLVLVNLVPLVGVFAFGWDVGALMLLYWAETVVIGLFNLPRLLTAGLGQGGPFALFGNLFLVAFFTVHFGMFNFGHFMFLRQMFDLPEFGRDLWFALGGLSLGHLFSLAVNWFGRGEYKAAKPNEQMFAPYGRVIVMHVVILIGGTFADGTAGIAPLVLLVVLKTGADIAAHAASHGWINMREQPA
ncbi:MAG: DUF6498-containing protein [Pseudomonadota bacterium]